MEKGRVIRGEPFDWEQAERAQEALASAADKEGRLSPDKVLWGAAMSSDPGVCKCPLCEETLWREGEVLECPKCFTWFFVQTGNLATTAVRYLSIRYGLDLNPERARELLAEKTLQVLAQGAPCGGNEVGMAGAAFHISALWLLSEGRGEEIIEVVG